MLPWTHAAPTYLVLTSCWWTACWWTACCLPCRATGHSFKYAEYDPYGKQSNFSQAYMYQLFNLSADPFELQNLYNASRRTEPALVRTLKATLDGYAGCRNTGCP